MQSETYMHFEQLINLLTNNLQTFNIVSATSWSNTGWAFPEGESREFELCYFIDGSTNFQYRSKEETLKTGDMFLLNNKYPIACKSGSFTFLSVIFSVDDAECNVLYNQLKNCINHITGKHILSYGEGVEQHFKLLIREGLLKKEHVELNSKLLLIQLLIEVSRALKQNSKNRININNTRNEKLAWDIAAYLSENLNCKVTLADLGEKFRLNPRYLDKIFKLVMGVPIIQYQQRLKVDKSKKLLKNHGLSILNVSMELDFPSSQYFSHIFKKNTGMTPSEYRKTMG